mmetsp:Transcript_16522/g.35901  ORF Transcript_16522/g.35901 Transcript_16522/m.35901 type:complete len:312 (+) Transcript_16522:92-1027(+)|eukprot:CAMPEP_0172551590 /NCGR_PEP_ID=MMETSP1067-20121228/40088_1 /TAXON_ID=265564 ORGANISM="Thalassiosira punctigera, Strain Tpunct2005C2" /NCGR_SAMPLE_ID=MMETSP1067 /ASSEMBLY_ACC=CAM_ASM_000444 /LENGTH=311 /DNA_ID=CAMNT_0013339395 /DNA_START=155 /DNA_END=1090 /DNA_ORIENTATION=-
MLLSKSLTLTLVGAASTNVSAFAPTCLHETRTRTSSSPPLKGYLDDISSELYGPDSNPDPEAESREANKMDKSQVVSYGPGSLADFVDFGDEFDGGDGQMGVAGDGNKGLEKMDAVPQMAKSKMMSAKNAWGTSSGYADQLLSSNPKMDTARAQQLENWANQQEVRAKNLQMKEMADNFDSQQSSDEENWRQLAKFGVERTQDFDMEEEFGPVVAGDDIEGVIELTTATNRVATHDIYLRNPYMGFADFRAAFTTDTPMDWSVEPAEGSIMQREDTHFTVKFRPQGPGMIEGYLVIETEDFKKTWKVQGST